MCLAIYIHSYDTDLSEYNTLLTKLNSCQSVLVYLELNINVFIIMDTSHVKRIYRFNVNKTLSNMYFNNTVFYSAHKYKIYLPLVLSATTLKEDLICYFETSVLLSGQIRWYS